MLTTACVYRYFAAQPNDRLIQQLLGVLNASISQCELNARPMECSRSDGSVVASPVATTSQSFVTGFTEADSAVLGRMEYELGVIRQMGFVDYFLIVYDFINWARTHGIPVGPGRGSGAGCMIAYLIKITDIEPIRFNLLFERMLSLERVSPPDFDVDFCERRRQDVIEYVRGKYGVDRVANIVTYGKLGAKAVVRDLARVNGIPFDRANAIAKMVPDELKMTLKKAVEMSAELRQEIAHDPEVKHIFEEGEVIEGMDVVRKIENTPTGLMDKPVKPQKIESATVE